MFPLTLLPFQLLQSDPTYSRLLNGVPLPGEELEMVFNQETDQTVLIRCRAWPDKCTGQTSILTSCLFAHDWPLLSPYLSVFTYLFLPRLPWYLPFPTFDSSPKYSILSLMQSQNALPRHPIPPWPVNPHSLSGALETLSHWLISVGFTPCLQGWCSPATALGRAGPGCSVFSDQVIGVPCLSLVLCAPSRLWR